MRADSCGLGSRTAAFLLDYCHLYRTLAVSDSVLLYVSFPSACALAASSSRCRLRTADLFASDSAIRDAATANKSPADFHFLDMPATYASWRRSAAVAPRTARTAFCLLNTFASRKLVALVDLVEDWAACCLTHQPPCVAAFHSMTSTLDGFHTSTARQLVRNSDPDNFTSMA